jgi:hypothetical protein
MTDIDFKSYDLGRPEGRHAVLKSIPPEREAVRKVHAELLDLFQREMDFRKADHPDHPEWKFDYVELIYWCALLLYLVGDPKDVPLMWKAKHIDFDIGCCFDGQFLVGGGVEQTIEYLSDGSNEEAVEYIKKLRDLKEFDYLPTWEQFRVHYFYPHIAPPKSDQA